MHTMHMIRTLTFLVLLFALCQSNASHRTVITPEQMGLRLPERDGVFLIGVMRGPDGIVYFTTVQPTVGFTADTPMVDPPYRSHFRLVGCPVSDATAYVATKGNSK